jgi:hypothetical protein
MKLVKDELGWHIEGVGSERARLAFASQKDGRICYTTCTADSELDPTNQYVSKR